MSRTFESLRRAAGRGTNCLPEAAVRALCYALGPVSAVMFLHLEAYSAFWSVRFHAVHSMLLAATWAVAWSATNVLAAVSPYFLGAILREAVYLLNLTFVLLWVLLMATAYTGGRFAAIPCVHQFAVRLARRHDKRMAASGRTAPPTRTSGS